MRRIEIYTPKVMTSPGKHFKDKETGDCIICAFNLNEKCTPDCAACDKRGAGGEFSCSRIVGKDNIIGWIGELE